MKSITLQISEEELREVTQAYKVLQNFLEKIISPNELYTDKFLEGFYDGLTAKKREDEPRESLESVKKLLTEKGKLNG
jgi:hypothetical protein